MKYSGWLCPLRRRAAGRSSRKECDEDSLCCKPINVNEEYLGVFRTKSYMEICNKAQSQLGKTSSTRRLSSSSSLPLFMHLTEYLLEPRQEIISNMMENLKVHRLLVDYFEASLEACRCCDTILEGIHQMRLAYRRITRAVELSERVLDCTGSDDFHTQKAIICKELASFALQNNPLSSIISAVQFRDIHDRFVALLYRLKSKRGKIRRRLTLKRVCKRAGGMALVFSHSALLIGLLVFAFHSMVGLVAAPSIVGGFVGLFRKRIKRARERFRFRFSRSSFSAGRICEQLDVAAKGVYILINDLDTMSRMVKRLNDEVEHRKAVAEVCVKNGRCEILKQVMREFHDQETSFLDQLEELEEHVYLCFLTINRSRRLVMEEIAEK